MKKRIFITMLLALLASLSWWTYADHTGIKFRIKAQNFFHERDMCCSFCDCSDGPETGTCHCTGCVPCRR